MFMLRITQRTLASHVHHRIFVDVIYAMRTNNASTTHKSERAIFEMMMIHDVVEDDEDDDGVSGVCRY